MSQADIVSLALASSCFCEDRWVDPATGGCLKDNNFAPITLFLEKADAKAINDALAADTAFLQEQGIMDYSLLLALCPPDVPTPQTTGVHRRVFEAKESQSLGEARDCKLCLGLVDILVTYGWKKKVAHLLKSLTIGWVDAIDTMPPDIYAERFCNYLAKKLRPITALLQFTEVPKDIFKMPCSPMGRSGGTASFFAMELLQEVGEGIVSRSLGSNVSSPGLPSGKATQTGDGRFDGAGRGRVGGGGGERCA